MKSKSHLQEHHDGTTDVLPHFRIVVVCKIEQVLDELVDMQHQRLASTDDELVDAGDRVRPDFGI